MFPILFVASSLKRDDLALYGTRQISYIVMPLYSMSFLFTGALQPSLGLQLAGPYDILAGKHKSAKNSNPNYFLHWRHFYDPPEFQTILVGNAETQYHMGYYRWILAYYFDTHLKVAVSFYLMRILQCNFSL